jgi:hypothetical protein
MSGLNIIGTYHSTDAPGCTPYTIRYNYYGALVVACENRYELRPLPTGVRLVDGLGSGHLLMLVDMRVDNEAIDIISTEWSSSTSTNQNFYHHYSRSELQKVYTAARTISTMTGVTGVYLCPNVDTWRTVIKFAGLVKKDEAPPVPAPALSTTSVNLDTVKPITKRAVPDGEKEEDPLAKRFKLCDGENGAR